MRRRIELLEANSRRAFSTPLPFAATAIPFPFSATIEKNRQADWLAWSLQYLVGLAVGAMIGAISTGRRSSQSWLAPDLLLPLMGGAALVGAGLASLLGDQLWMGSSYKVIPPDAIRHSVLSNALSFLSMVAGATLIVLTLIANFTRNT